MRNQLRLGHICTVTNIRVVVLFWENCVVGWYGMMSFKWFWKHYAELTNNVVLKNPIASKMYFNVV